MQDILVGFIIIFLILVAVLLAVALLYLFQQLRKSQSKVENAIKNYEGQLRDIHIKHQREIEKARQQSVETSRRTIKGQIAEQLAPLLPGFPYLPSDSHFIGDPVDYIVFNGYTEYKEHHGSNDNLELVIIDIKHSKAHLSEGQKQIAKAIEAGNVRFETVRVFDDGKIETHSWDSSKKKESITPAESKPVETPSKVEVSPTVTETQSSENISNGMKNWYAFLQKYPNAYEPWGKADDNLLKEKYMAGMKVNELALLLKRNPGKIRSRLKEKGLIKKA
ncbi:MAG: Holliday junction resolvase-like protein [Chloroflexota bacterium]